MASNVLVLYSYTVYGKENKWSTPVQYSVLGVLINLLVIYGRATDSRESVIWVSRMLLHKNVQWYQ